MCLRFCKPACCELYHSLKTGTVSQKAMENVGEKCEERLLGWAVQASSPHSETHLASLSPSAIVREAVSWAEDQGKGSASGKSPGGFLKLEDKLEGTRHDASSQTWAQGGQSKLGASAGGRDISLARCPEAGPARLL